MITNKKSRLLQQATIKNDVSHIIYIIHLKSHLDKYFLNIYKRKGEGIWQI